ncbi:MAG TPA: tubulin-like doman-containing protein, partial [Chthonomonadaceae bacterium]|nr:tubulin-like doman-containing protein [Chthonomonadaceae bacterium]
MAETNPNEIAVYPTMVVGLGGTGCKIAKRLKRTLNAEGVAALNIKFVGIDTDLAESSARNEAELPLDRFITIGGQPVHFDPNDRSNEPLLSWLPTDDSGKMLVGASNLGAGQGAGGHRLMGRFAYNYFAPNQFINLQQTIDQLLDLGVNPLAQQWEGIQFKYLPGMAVYVIGSLVGGTGSGIFLDTLATLHHLTGRALADRTRFFSGLFLLPSVFDYRAIGSQSYDHSATAYACLKDLDLLLERDDPDLHSFWFYNEPRPYTPTQRLLDSCYLVDRYSGSGALMTDEDVYD